MGKLAKKILKVSLGIIVILYISFLILEDYWYRQIIPENIGLDYHISIGATFGLREGCAVAVYRLGDVTYFEIQKKG